MKREEAVELRATAEVDEVAADAGECRIARRSRYRQPVGRATLDDEDEPTLRIRSRERHARKAEACETCGRSTGSKKEPARQHDHLLTNSGLTSTRASPSAGLSARAIAVRVASLRDPGKSVSASLRASIDDAARSAIRCATSTRNISASGAAQLAAM